MEADQLNVTLLADIPVARWAGEGLDAAPGEAQEATVVKSQIGPGLEPQLFLAVTRQ